MSFAMTPVVLPNTPTLNVTARRNARVARQGRLQVRPLRPAAAGFHMPASAALKQRQASDLSLTRVLTAPVMRAASRSVVAPLVGSVPIS